jgi:hypothetical protein
MLEAGGIAGLWTDVDQVTHACCFLAFQYAVILGNV